MLADAISLLVGCIIPVGLFSAGISLLLMAGALVERIRQRRK
jgi:hypothetical protein